VNEPHLAEAAGARLLQVFAYHVAHVAGAKGVKVEGLFDRNLEQEGDATLLRSPWSSSTTPPAR
jgi:hypothetical protein